MKKGSIIAWTLAVIILIVATLDLIYSLVNRGSQNSSSMFERVFFAFVLPVAFGAIAALIITHQPRNVIGWLLFLPALTIIIPVDVYIETFTNAPVHPPPLLLVSLWFSNWAWLLLIFPILFIPVLFPTGRPASPRWRWLVVAGLIMCGFFLLVVTFHPSFNTENQGMNWSVKNPIGFLPDLGNSFLIPWILGLLLLTILSVVSLFIRYRYATSIVREQIKWLLFACALFALFYSITGILMVAAPDSALQNLSNILWTVSLLAIPASIAVSILRYHLWDIDVIIRKTLVYSALTALLALIFLGVITLLQSLFAAISNQRSEISIVISTLTIAGLFSPLRRWLQNRIDRYFYRKKYDAELALARFSSTARTETHIEQLSAELLAVVQETIQPQMANLWLKPVISKKGFHEQVK